MTSSPAGRAEPESADGSPVARRLLFVSSITAGGSGRSQRELAAALVTRGSEVRFLVDRGDRARVRRRLLEELTDASVRLGDTALRGSVEVARRRIGSRPSTHDIDGLRHEATIGPENAFDRAVRAWRPDVVVASSISRVSWRAIRALCGQRGIPTVLYLREAEAIGHLAAGLGPDLVMANSETLVADAQRVGWRAELVPSLVRIPAMESPPSGAVLLLVNPRPSHGIHVVGPLAASRPDIPIVLQESWPLTGPEQAEVARLVDHHANVSFRPFDPRPGMLFRDTRVLLAPHMVDNRPRTVLEAQANGLPVVASDLPGLIEAVGAGGLVVASDSGPDGWLRAVAAVWDDEDLRMNLGDRARMHAARPEVRPEAVVGRFAELVDDLLDLRRSQARPA